MRAGHYFKIAVRQFRRHKSSFIINVVGLSTGLACALLILLWVRDEVLIDKFHVHDARLFQVMEFQAYSEGEFATQSTPGVLAENLALEFPEIELATMMDWGTDWTLSSEDVNIKAEGRHVSPDFLKMFTYPLIEGDIQSCLVDPTSIVLTESTAIALFGTASNIIGRTVQFQHDLDLQVTGVLEDVGSNSTHSFDYLMTWEKFLDENDWARDWGNNGPHTYAMLQEGADNEAVSEKIAGFVADRDEDSNVTLFLKRFSERYLYGRYENRVLVGGRIEYVRLFTIIALFVLLIASINFMNLSTARASRRAREVGVKKAVGASRSALIQQYLTESVLISIASLVIAIGLAWLALPQFNLMTDKDMALIPDPMILLGFIGLALVTGIVAGSYPALYLSSFKPAAVLKGTIKSSVGELWARKGLVVFQFSVSVFLIASVVIIYKQIQYIQNRNLGYNKDQIVMLDLDGTLENQCDVFIDMIKPLPGISNASSIGHSLIGRNNNTSGLEWTGKNPDDRILFENMRVNFDALETMGVTMKEGRSFSRQYGTDSTKIIFNEAAIKVMGMADPIGETIRLWGEYDLEIIGVVEDFHFQSLHEPVKPVFFWLRPPGWFLMVSLEAGKESTALAELEKAYKSFNPGFPFEYHFVDDDYGRLYAAEMRVATLSRYFAGVAIIISCLGLFGLAAFTAERRKKEIGIRKVLGASIAQVIALLTREFSRLVLISLIIGLPLAYYVLSQWMDRFEFKIVMSPWHFILAGVLVLIIAWLTVSTQAYRSAAVNPRECLRDE